MANSNKWEKIKRSTNLETKENKIFFHKRTKSGEYLNEFKIEWQWNDYEKQKKILKNKEEALRFYECIDITKQKKAA